jgi:hypothetical protein
MYSRLKQGNEATSGAAAAMERLMSDLAQQTPDLLQRMQLNLPLPRPTVKLIRTLARLTLRDDAPAASGRENR